MIFVDTGAWIALMNRKDENHDDAVAIYRNLKQRREQLFTTDHVINEIVTYLRSRRSQAFQFLDIIGCAEKTSVLTVPTVSSPIFEEAKRLFREHNGIFTFTECTSLAFCRRHEILEVFAYNQNFTAMKLVLVAHQPTQKHSSSADSPT